MAANILIGKKEESASVGICGNVYNGMYLSRLSFNRHNFNFFQTRSNQTEDLFSYLTG